jgi:hypothetical protein
MRVCSTLIAVAGIAAPAMAGALGADEIMAKFREAEKRREQKVEHYSVTRRYTVKNEDGARSAATTVKIDFRANNGKTYKILSEAGGSDFLFRRAIRKVLDAEVETSKGERRDETRFTPGNYEFELLGNENIDGHNCYMIALKPRRKSKYLIDGKAWIDANEFAMVRLEGRSAARLSFWVGRSSISEEFQKVGDIWLLSRNRSAADCRFIGRAELTIESNDLEAPGAARVAIAQRSEAPPLPALD